MKYFLSLGFSLLMWFVVIGQNSGDSCEIELQKSLQFIYGSKLVAQNVPRGMNKLRKLASEGCVEAKYRMGYIFYRSEYDYKLSNNPQKKNIQAQFTPPEKAFKFFNRAHNLGHVRAKVFLGKSFQKGLGCKLNYNKAMSLYKEAYEAGDEIAPFLIGYNHFKGLGSVEQNYSKAIKWFKKTDFAMAKHYLAICYYFGYGAPVDKDKAIELLLSSEGNLNSPTLLKHLQDSFDNNTQGVLSDFKGENIVTETKKINTVLTSNDNDLSVTTLEILSSNDLEGEWTGKLVDLDYSGERILRSFPAKITMAKDSDTEGITYSAEIHKSTQSGLGVLLDESLYFENFKITLPRLYKDHPKVANWDYSLLSAELSLKTINHITYLTAYIETKNLSNNEPGTPKLLILTNSKITTENGVELTEELIQALLDAQGDNFITLYPNPFKSDLLIQYELAEDATTTVEVYNLSGTFFHTVAKNKVQTKGKKLFHFEGSQLNQGLYVVKVTVNNTAYTKLIIKEN